jgi:hypothetical protein
MVQPKELLAWSVGIVMALILAVYAGDFLWFEYRKWTPKPNDPLESFTFYYATPLKNGRMEVFYDQPQKQTCVHALFPHAGYNPCWYLRKSDIKPIE